MKTPLRKPIPPRASQIAEEDARKVRMEPPKGTRQDRGFPLSSQKSRPPERATDRTRKGKPIAY